MSKSAKDLARQRKRVFKIGAAESLPRRVETDIPPRAVPPTEPTEYDREVARIVLEQSKRD